MNGRVILWLLVAASCNAARVAALPRQSPGNAEGKQQLEKTDNMARKMRYWFEPVKGLKVDMDSNELLVKYSPYKNLESRDGGVSVAGGVSGEKQHKKGKKDKGKTKDKPTMMQKLGTFMMMIPVTMQFMQMPMAIASIKMQLLRSILVGKLALFILFLRTLLTNRQVKEKIVVVRTPPKEVHEHFYHPFEDPEDNKPGWLGGGGGGGPKGHKPKPNHHRDYDGEVYEHNNDMYVDEYEKGPSTWQPPQEMDKKKPTAHEALKAIDTYTKWFDAENDIDSEEKMLIDNLRNKALDRL